MAEEVTISGIIELPEDFTGRIEAVVGRLNAWRSVPGAAW